MTMVQLEKNPFFKVKWEINLTTVLLIISFTGGVFFLYADKHNEDLFVTQKEYEKDSSLKDESYKKDLKMMIDKIDDLADRQRDTQKDVKQISRDISHLNSK